MPTALSVALADGACLIYSTDSESDLKTLLDKRLSSYYTRTDGGRRVPESSSLEDIQLATALEALSVITRVQKIIGVDETPGVEQPPLIGTRDLKELGTLLSIAFRWGIDRLYAKALLAWPDTVPVSNAQRIIELKTPSEDYATLTSMTLNMLRLVFPDGFRGRIPQTLITTTILEKHAMDLLKPSIMLGWLPKSLASDLRPVLDIARPMTTRFLNFLLPLQTITALGGILSSTPHPPQYVRKLCISLLGQQLLRPQGVRSLCAAVFGENDSPADDSWIEKLQHITRVLLTVPFNTKPKEYFDQVIPRIVDLLAPPEPPTNKRAAAYVISRMLSADATSRYQDLISKTTYIALLLPFSIGEETPEMPTTAISTALTTLITLVSNADPSPTLISALLSPILTILYSLLYHMDHVKTMNPSLRESLRGLMVTWGKIVGAADGVNILWSIMQSEETKWTIDLEGNIKRPNESETISRLSLLTPQDLKDGEGGDYSLESNILGLYPDPNHFVQFLKTIDRADISSDFFVKLLEAYRDQKTDDDEDPTRPLLYLQIIMQMQAQLTDGKSSANILCKPTHLLSFIRHVLEPQLTAPHKARERHQDSNSRVNLKIHAEQEGELSDEGDSDDDTPGAEIITIEGEMIETSLNLLLSILEANEDLSARNVPLLNDIFSLLEPLAREGSEIVRPLAREARMVMTARLASTSSGKSTLRSQDEETAHDIYQKSLKLLQDPILPVRAHGLLLLRQLVTPSTPDLKDPKLNDDALVPAILSIFLQSVQDDDSYMFLNAVQGLAAMVDRFGKDVLIMLVKEYAGGLDGLGASNLTQRDLDTRTRVGEALAAVIRRCGDALMDILVPPLFRILRLRHIPTSLRTSSLSLLADCESTSSVAMLPYVTDLAGAMLDILQLEIVPVNLGSRNNENQETQASSMDSEPLSSNAKFPPLRRAALHFLALMVRETTKQIYESSFAVSLFSDDFMRRAKTILGYVASVDSDNIVRVMAREAVEDLEHLNTARLGL
ncbi:hypothetical protein C0991_001189 [Blastosporella zonata]|nr:hypothetical protein C0991_001189 [Blastosporella zonata]